jgi:septum formation protein
MLLERAGFRVVKDPASIDEDEVKAAFRAETKDAARCAVALAEAKAARVSRRHPGDLVIGADQMLDCNGVWLDKPPDVAHARAQLIALRGKRHELVCAVTVYRDGERLWHWIDRAQLEMRVFSDEFLDAYMAACGEALLGSVGAYQLEGMGVHLFARVEGDFFSILGLPLLPLLDFLRSHDAALR